MSNKTAEQKAKHAEAEKQRRARLGDKYRESERARHRSQKRQDWIKEYTASHMKEAAAAQRLYRKRHPDIANARWEKWHRENPELTDAKDQVCGLRGKYRIKYNATLAEGLTVRDWVLLKAIFNHCCAYCGKYTERLCQDHIIPASKGGGHVLQNIVPACRSCNSKKHVGPPPVPVQPMLL